MHRRATGKQTHKTHHGLDLKETTTFPLIAYTVSSHGINTQMSFCPKIPKLKSWNSQNWHTTCTRANQGDSRLLMIGSQIGNLTPDPSFGHNLCFRYPNGLCEPILDIYIPRAFQWYKELFNPMSFDPCNRSLKIWESIGIPTPKVGAHLGVWGFIPSHSLALSEAWNVTLGLTFGLHLCKPLPWSQAQG